MEKPTDGRTRAARENRVDERPKRPTAGEDGPLSVPKEYIKPGYVPYLAIDKPGNIERLLRQGWEFIDASSDLGFQRSENATQDGSHYTIPAGGGRTYFALQIRKEWYDEIQEELTKDARESEKAMRYASTQGLPTGAETYCPDGRTSVLSSSVKTYQKE